VIAVVRSEWLKLRTTAVPWVLGAIALIINGLLILVIFLTPNPQSIGNSGYEVPHTTQQLRNLVGSGFQGYLLALLLGVLCITVEFRHKTVTTAFLVTPRRTAFVGGKLLLAAIAGAVLAVTMLVATLIGGGLTLDARGGSFTAMLHQLPAVAPGMILVFALFAILGVGIGSVLTNQVAAIIVVLGWFIILEGILVSLVHGAEKWVPSGAALAASNLTPKVGGGPGGRPGLQLGLFSWWEGGLLMLFYGLVFAVVGSIILSRRDIT